MSALIRTMAAVAALALGAGQALAKPISEADITSAKVQLDPQMGYVFIQSANRWFGTFLRVPDDETRSKYKQDLDKAFAKAERRYPGQLASWQANYDLAVRTKKKLPARPEAPNRETFSIDPIELRDSVAIGPMFVYSKAERNFGYLTSVKPGAYIFYGPMMVAAENGAVGSCLCMGTVSFEVIPGVITDLGNFLQAAPEQIRNWDVGTSLIWRKIEEKAAKSGKPEDLGSFDRQEVEFGLPPSLSGWQSVRAEFHASGKMNNFYGVGISRLTPIPGVLAYKRDTVIDARTGEAVPNPPIVTQVRIKK